jgi:hypothetical protein
MDLQWKAAMLLKHIPHQQFEPLGLPSSNTEGITIWETDDVQFDNCNIYSKVMEGIRTYDASIKVFNGCDIEGNQTGISSYATYPMTNKIIVGTTGDENSFFGNQYDINASLATGWFGLYSNGKFSLDVINNNFEGSQYGVIVDGPSNFRIGGNKFTDVRIGAWTANTGFNNVLNQNLVGCNLFTDRMDIGILAIGENKQMQFLANDFNSAYTTSRDFILTHSFFPGNSGAIRALQGNPDVPASNCFTNPGTQADILTSGITDFFTYYYQSGEPPVDCEPEPLTLGNYGKTPVTPSIFVIDCAQFGGLPHGFESPTPGDLNTKRTQLQQLSVSMATNPNDKILYYQALQDKEAILKHLLGQSLEIKDYTTVESLLAGEQSKAANWAIFGLRMDRKDYTAAAQWLNQLPIQNDADTQFRDVQLINIQRLQNPATFQLSAAQEAQLAMVAESSSPVRGYARGILGLLKDRRFYPEAYEFGEERSISAKPTVKEDIQLFPVPAANSLAVSWPPMQPGSNPDLQVFDVLGRSCAYEDISTDDSQHLLNVSQLPNGVYFLIISDKGKPVHRAKFTVQH